MGPGVTDKLIDYWATVGQLYTSFYGTMLKQDQYLHILTYILLTTGMNLIEQKFWQTMEDRTPIWNSKCHIFQILQPFWISGYWKSYCFLQEKHDFRTKHTKEMQEFQYQNFQTLWLNWIHIWKSILGEGQTAHGTASDHKPREWQNWQGRQKDVATNYTWTISFLLLNNLTAWRRNRFTLVGLSGWKGEACCKA